MSAQHPGRTLLVVSSAAFLASLDLFIVNIAFPAIRADFPGSDLAQMSWVLNGYTVVFAAFLAVAGRLADRFGHKRVFLVGLAVFTLASAACAAAPSVALLVAARAVQALGASMLTPTSLSLLLAAYPAERRAHAVGIWASIGAVAAALGPPLGGLLVEASWHWVFLVNLPVAGAALVAGVRVLDESAHLRTGMPDLVGAIGLVVGVGALAWALVRAPDTGWADPQVTLGLVAAVAGIGFVVIRSRRHPEPALDLAVLRHGPAALASTAMLVFTAGFAALLVVNVLFLTGTWGYPAPLAGLALAPGPLVVVVVARFSGRLQDRFGIGPLAAAGGLVFAAGTAWWALRAGAEPDYLGVLLPGQLGTGLAVGLILPALSSAVGTYLTPAQWGSGSSLINTARQIGSVLGIAAVVTIVGTASTGAVGDLPLLRHGWVFLVVTGLATAMLGAGLAVARRPVSQPQPVPDPR
ncbi:DHA2 family efflux MFS transporter permease subunit [Pseudonocardia sp. CA-107938]|uniref:DHA2 family efflux MFS transporter permease subunit n=1 Tax=Pseudonocardia sp. CA-107938 TaxID=3240021 RepID=UPI003D8FBD23